MAIQLDTNALLKLLAEPSVFTEIGFLEPVKGPALRLALTIKNSGCTGCARKRLEPTLVALGGAIARLLVDESAKPSNALQAFKTKAIQIVDTTATEIRVSYTDKAGIAAELLF